MNESNRRDEAGGPSVRALEIGVAAAFMALGALIMYENGHSGAGWGPSGPDAGYFPFRIGLLMAVASAVVFVRALATRGPHESFVEPRKFRHVLSLVAPTVVYIAVTAFLGIYVTSALYLGFFMAVLGRYRPLIILPVAAGVPAVLFLLFEVWFLVPLPKGPLETWLGY